MLIVVNDFYHVICPADRIEWRYHIKTDESLLTVVFIQTRAFVFFRHVMSLLMCHFDFQAFASVSCCVLHQWLSSLPYKPRAVEQKALFLFPVLTSFIPTVVFTTAVGPWLPSMVIRWRDRMHRTVIGIKWDSSPKSLLSEGDWQRHTTRRYGGSDRLNLRPSFLCLSLSDSLPLSFFHSSSTSGTLNADCFVDHFGWRWRGVRIDYPWKIHATIILSVANQSQLHAALQH